VLTQGQRSRMYQINLVGTSQKLGSSLKYSDKLLHTPQSAMLSSRDDNPCWLVSL